MVKLRVPHFEIGPCILCGARQAFKALAASCSIGLCEVLFRWKVHENFEKCGHYWNVGKNNSCQQADEVSDLAYCDNDETRVFSGSCLSCRSRRSQSRPVLDLTMFRVAISRSANDALSINFMIDQRLLFSRFCSPLWLFPAEPHHTHRYVMAITSVLLTPNQRSALQGRSTDSRPNGTVILFSPRKVSRATRG
jgi:hypothetical protein